MIYDAIVIGGGPAGLTASVYLRRAGKSALVIEKAAFGGQITRSPNVENFPGYVSVSGTQIGDMLLEQAMNQGAEVELDEVVSVSVSDGIKTLRCSSGEEFSCRALIIATGASPRTLGLPNEEKLTGSGVCYCSVCDGAFFAGQDVAVMGGGNSALQDAMLLSEVCRHVYLIHRRDSFRGEAKLVEALSAKANVEFVLEAQITALQGENELSGLEIIQRGERRVIQVSGLFVAIGRKPDTEIFAGMIDLGRDGYAASGEDCLTVCPGVFVAGDCRAKGVRQLTTAMADGSVAALAACSWLDK